MIPIDIQVSRSKVKVKGHASLLHLVQLVTQERLLCPPFKEGGAYCVAHVGRYVGIP